MTRTMRRFRGGVGILPASQSSDDDGDFGDETVLLTSTQVDDDWSGGYVGLFRGNQDTNVHQFDDFKVGYDNNADGDFDDGGDVLAVSDDFNSSTITLDYDANGNLTDDGIFVYAYDAWNRLRLAKLVVASDSTTIGDYEYYGDNRRSRKIVSNHGPEVHLNDGGDRQTRFYYDDQWRIVETRNGSDQAVQHMLWGTQYIDEFVMFENNGDPGEGDDTDPDERAGESTEDARYFAHQDRNWNVVALSQYDPNTAITGATVDRYVYRPYGIYTVIGSHGAYVATSPFGISFAHQGLCVDAERAGYHNRNREYIPYLSRFAQRDPLRENSISYTAYELLPIRWTDPTGLYAQDATSQPCPPPCERQKRTYAGCKDGKCTPLLSESDERRSDPVKECIKKHEQLHCEQFKNARLTCDGIGDYCLPGGGPAPPEPYRPVPPKPRDEPPKPPPDPQPIQYECAAYKLSLRCLESKERECNGDEYCIKDVQWARCNSGCQKKFHCKEIDLNGGL